MYICKINNANSRHSMVIYKLLKILIFRTYDDLTISIKTFSTKIVLTLAAPSMNLLNHSSSKSAVSFVSQFLVTPNASSPLFRTCGIYFQ